MPLYEFRCESCGHETETILLFSDPLPTICETCGGPLKKLLSAPAVQFKGSGFYLTDYGRSGSAADSGKKAADAGEAKPSGEGKSSGDSKAPGESKSSGESKPSSEGKSSGETKSGAAGGTTAGSGGDAKTAG
jgi:putative FmdB family regulatory protein